MEVHGRRLQWAIERRIAEDRRRERRLEWWDSRALVRFCFCGDLILRDTIYRGVAGWLHKRAFTLFSLPLSTHQQTNCSLRLVNTLTAAAFFHKHDDDQVSQPASQAATQQYRITRSKSSYFMKWQNTHNQRTKHPNGKMMIMANHNFDQNKL